MKVSRKKLHHEVWNAPLGTVAARYGLSGNGLAKICDRLAIPRPGRSHWTRPAMQRESRPALPPAPVGLAETFELGPRQSRRSASPRSRMDLEQRRARLMDVAEDIAIDEGIARVTIRRIARWAGISETQVHNCFGGRVDLLVELARREIRAQETNRRERIARNADRRTRIVLSTVGYLHEAAARGPLLQLLLRQPEVRRRLSAERGQLAADARAPIIRHLTDHSGLDAQTARAATAALTAVSLRAGGIVAARRAPLALVEQMCLSIVMAGVASGEAMAEK